MLKGRSLLERCVTLPVGTWSVVLCQQPFVPHDTTSQETSREGILQHCVKTHKPREQDREERKVLRKTNGRAHARPLKVAGTSSVWCHRLHANNRFAASAVTCAISQLRTSSERKLSLSATRQPFMVEIALLYVFSLSNSLVFVSFLRLCDRSHTQDQAGSMPSTQAVAPSSSHNRDGSEVRTFDKRTHRHKPFDRQRSVSVLWLRHTQLHDLFEVWSLTDECSPPVRGCSPPDRNRSIFFRSNLCRFRSKFAWALPLSLSSPWAMIFFSKTTNTDKKWKLVPNARLPR